MVTTYGMSKTLGPLAYEKGQQNSFLGDGMMNPRRLVSDDTAKAIDNEVKEIVENGHQQGKEVIEGEQLQALLDRVKPLDREPVTV